MPVIEQAGKSSAFPHPFSLAGLWGWRGRVLLTADACSLIRSGLLQSAWVLLAQAGQWGSAGSLCGAGWDAAALRPPWSSRETAKRLGRDSHKVTSSVHYNL